VAFKRNIVLEAVAGRVASKENRQGVCHPVGFSTGKEGVSSAGLRNRPTCSPVGVPGWREERPVLAQENKRVMSREQDSLILPDYEAIGHPRKGKNLFRGMRVTGIARALPVRRPFFNECPGGWPLR